MFLTTLPSGKTTLVPWAGGSGSRAFGSVYISGCLGTAATGETGGEREAPELHRAPGTAFGLVPTPGRGTRALVSLFSSLEPPALGFADSRRRMAHCHWREEKSPSPTVAAPTQHPRSTRYFSTPSGRLSPVLQVPARIQGAGEPRQREQTELPPVCAHAEGTRRSLAEHTPPTRLPRSHGILPCPVPASGRWHQKCCSSRSRSLLAITARIQRENGQGEPDPEAGGGGRAGQNHKSALIYGPSQEPDPHPPCGHSLAHSSPPAPPAWSSHQSVAIPPRLSRTR